METLPDPLLGQSIGNYRLERLIGEGGMGRVYEGLQPQIGARVAIKVLTCETGSGEAINRFFDEARAVNRIRHEAIVDILDLGCLRDGRPYIVMEFLDGAPLSKHIARGPLPLGTAVKLVCDVLDPVAAAHEHGIVHRDLKPDNIFCTSHGRIEVLDFGIAKLGEGGATQTRAGSILGTPAYMAPEQGAGRPVDARADLYAMGVVLYEAVTGRRPFQSEILLELLQMHATLPPTPPSRLRAGMPPALEAIILQALAKRPEDRFQSAAEMRDALVATLEEIKRPADWQPLGPPTGRVARPLPTVVTAPRPRRWIVGALAALGIAGVVATVLLATAGRPPAAEPVVKAAAVEMPAPPPPPAPAKCDGNDAKSCEESCDAGDLDSCLQTGFLYQQGTTVIRDDSRAFAFYNRACPKNDIACNEVGIGYKDGKGVASDVPRAVAIFSRLCDTGFLDGCTNLGVTYEQKFKEPARAIELYQRACDGGNARGCSNLAGLYAEGWGVKKDIARALSLYERTCDLGGMYGCTKMGAEYYVGRFLKRDFVRSTSFYVKACDGGDPAGCFDLGLNYREGSGVRKDPAYARTLFTRACAGGFERGCRER